MFNRPGQTLLIADKTYKRTCERNMCERAHVYIIYIYYIVLWQQCWNKPTNLLRCITRMCFQSLAYTIPVVPNLGGYGATDPSVKTQSGPGTPFLCNMLTEENYCFLDLFQFYTHFYKIILTSVFWKKKKNVFDITSTYSYLAVNKLKIKLVIAFIFSAYATLWYNAL